MRFVVRAIFPIEAGNRAVKYPNFLKNIEGFIKDTRAEAAHFLEINGDRTAVFIIDLQSTDMIPVIAELFFRMGAKVEFHPAMDLTT